MFRYRAIAALELTDVIHDEVFRIIKDMLEKKESKMFLECRDYLNELKEFSKLRKRNVFDYEQTYEAEFNYDFKNLMEKDFEVLPRKLDKPVKVRFFTDNEKKLMIKEQIAERGSDVDGIGKILSRTLGSMLLRNVEFEQIAYEETQKEKMVKEIEILQKDVGINQSPGEFV